MFKISIIIPTYQPGNYLYDALDSISKQTFCIKDFQIILVLNGAKYPYFDKINEYVAESKLNIQFLYVESSGVSRSRNVGLEMADGKYISFIDDDDFISENFLKNLFETAERTNAKITQSNFITINNGKHSLDYISKAYKKMKGKKFSLLRYRKFYSSVCGKLYLRTFIGDIRFNENLETAEDALFLFELTQFEHQLVFSIGNPIYYRRIRMNSITRKEHNFKTIVKNYFKKVSYFSKIYYIKVNRINFFFYITRIFALTKVFILESLKIYYKKQ